MCPEVSRIVYKTINVVNHVTNVTYGLCISVSANEMGCYQEILNNEHLLNCPKLNGNTSKEETKYILNRNNKHKKKIFFFKSKKTVKEE